MPPWLTARLAAALTIPSDPPAAADLIFCFAGRKSRKLFALDLYTRGLAPRLILSTGRFELRRYPDLPGVPLLDLVAHAAPVQPELRHYFVLLEAGNARPQLVPKLRLGTLTEVVALRDFLVRHQEVSSVLVVSSAPHLRRIRQCWQAVMPAAIGVKFVASPPEPERLRVLLAEAGKLMLYRLCSRSIAIRAIRTEQ